jgi:hypothetical protein
LTEWCRSFAKPQGETLNRKTYATIVAACAAFSLFGTSVASAATAVGNTCTGDRAELEGATIVQLASTSNPASVSIPQAGVITKWGVNVVPYPGGISEKLKVMRPAGPNTFTAVAESTTQPIGGGQNAFETRLPVQAGDRLGAYSAVAPIYCAEASAPTDILGGVIGDTAIGSSATFTEVPEGQLALSATVEPDADGDGYGDESQDKCPGNAAVQTPCPIVTLSSSLVVKKGLLNVLVTTNVQASVTVKGTVEAGKGKAIKLSGGTQIVVPGTIARFTVLFTKGLKKKLAELSPKQSLPLKLSVTSPNVVGAPSKKIFKKKLRGEAKPKPRRKPKAQA